ncbi:hypothetical protein EDD18DRAFT_1107704 [Armillaria luteobubalina]|uniref:Uncharacterized protein n=1 Tax=Armillaria luteobubalina TaxID=153913 RepID=A0AA39TL81_9AGAR|nr:hypothetical protein EDD18DRAFT_1107704 [Armillaria luteobubalina]
MVLSVGTYSSIGREEENVQPKPNYKVVAGKNGDPRSCFEAQFEILLIDSKSWLARRPFNEGVIPLGGDKMGIEAFSFCSSRSQDIDGLKGGVDGKAEITP